MSAVSLWTIVYIGEKLSAQMNPDWGEIKLAAGELVCRPLKRALRFKLMPDPSAEALG